MISPAPVVIFAYNRPDHLKTLLTSLSENRGSSNSSVVIFLDGPKNDFDFFQQSKILDTLNETFPFKSIEVRRSERNKGLANSIRLGVTQILSENSRIIVLEDDLVLSPFFLEFMNSALDFYESQTNVASIHGFQYPLKQTLSEPVFFRGADCWGWATWRDRWDNVSFDSLDLLKKIEELELIDSFNLGGSMDFYGLLLNQSRGKVDSWAICWHASMFLQNRFTLFPPKSFVQNHGNDGTGIHSGVNNFFETRFASEISWEYPVLVNESVAFRELLADFYKKSLNPSRFSVAKTKFFSIFGGSR